MGFHGPSNLGSLAHTEVGTYDRYRILCIQKLQTNGKVEPKDVVITYPKATYL